VIVEHTTISTDLKGGADIVIRAAGIGSFGIQLKTLNRNGYTDASQDELVRKAMKTKQPNTTVSEFGSIDLQEMIQKEREGMPDVKLRNRLLSGLVADFERDHFSKAKELIQRLAEAPKVNSAQTISLPPDVDAPRIARRRIVGSENE
jgi:hypothetical protein